MKLKVLFFSFAIILIANTLKSQTIFKVDSVNNAHIRVYVTNEVNKADLKVYNVNTQEEANKDGLWYLTTNESEAFLKVYYFTEEKNELIDLYIYNVSDPNEAGWINNDKRYLYKIPKK